MFVSSVADGNDSSKHPSWASEHSGQVGGFSFLSPRISTSTRVSSDQTEIHRSQRTRESGSSIENQVNHTVFVVREHHQGKLRRLPRCKRFIHALGQVTPSSKVVGDFAQWMTSNSLSKADVLAQAEGLDFPSSVVEFFQGYLGQPVGGFPEPLRTRIIRNKPRIDGRPGASMEPLDFKKIKAELRSKFGKHITDVDVTSYVMYPKVRTKRSCATLADTTTADRFSRSTRALLRSMAILGQLLSSFSLDVAHL